MGELFWIDASAPVLTGAFPTYRRLVVALDTGGAIKGEVRADLYMGRGDEAGIEAGRVRHVLKMYRLVPVPPGGS
jgi:membrane-bound lytic murein transglycosylase A